MANHYVLSVWKTRNNTLASLQPKSQAECEADIIRFDYRNCLVVTIDKTTLIATDLNDNEVDFCFFGFTPKHVLDWKEAA